MSKAAAMALMTGLPASSHEVKPSLLTPDVPASGNADSQPEAAAPKEELQSSRLAILAKKEAALIKEREALKKDREQYLKDKEVADGYLKRGKEFDETFSKDKKAALKLLGYTDTDIVNFMAEADIKEPTAEDIARRVAKEEAQTLRDEMAKEKAENQTAYNNRLVTGLKTDIKNSIKDNPDKYDFCTFEGPEAETMAYQVIVDELKETGKLLSHTDALDIVEELLEEQDKERRARIKKLQAAKTDALSSDKSAPTSLKDAEPLKSNAKPKTLTNAIAPTTAASVAPRSETRDQKKQRLVNALLAMGKT